jgi:hypothetical protein
MATITETELQKRLRKLEAAALDPSDTVVLTDDQYTLSENVIYVAYASALSNLVNGTIPNQSDATDFQYSPYNAAGVLMAYRGYFSSTSIYASGDPTDYTWESTSGLTGFTSSERYYTTSTGLLSALGNPTEPGSGITWTIIASGNAIPGTAVWYAERFTVSGITSGWTITAVGAYVNTSILQDDAVTTTKITDNAITTAKVTADAITGAKIDSATTITAGSSNDVAVLDGVDSTYRIYAGHSTPASAPFRVKKDGTVIIESAASGSRLVIDDDTIKVYDGSTLRVKLGNLA